MTRVVLRISVMSLLLTLLAVPTVRAQEDGELHQTHLASFQVVTVADDLDHPWSMAFLPNGDMLFTERAGQLRIIRDGVLQAEPIAGVPAVRAQGQGGLLEVALHPDFAQNQLIYLTFSKPNADATEGTTALVRGRFDGERLTDVEEIFEAKAWSRRGSHFGSRIAFDRDGYLFMTVGDRGASPDPATVNSHPAQDLSNHQGTVIRLHDDGRVPDDNPFVGRAGALPEIWSYGHRNLQGLAFNPETGDLWIDEHGPQGGDELNLILPGRNYGWPVIGYGLQYGGTVIHASTRQEGMEQPRHYWVPSIATSGLLFYTGDAFPGWRGSVFVGGLAGQQLARLTLDGQHVTGEETLLEGYGRIRDIRQGPDGFIYLAIDARGPGTTPIVRLEPR
ncbi:MAG: PQQ-dependent sugar dehydrogenase [Gemmatimonadetes bacterium]|nr:PQQ-dependent sugar dehydrogenase [Gemmatimonadota bacterium]